MPTKTFIAFFLLFFFAKFKPSKEEAQKDKQLSLKYYTEI